MTKTHYILSAVAGLLLAGSCQREGLECVGGAETVSYTVQVPECLAVKAGEGAGATGVGAAGDGFTVYYEVYRDGDLDKAGVAPVYEGQEEFVDGTATLDLKFAKEQDYTVLFWAQKTVGVTAYDIDDLRDVQLNVGALKTNDLNADAFAGKDHVHNCASAAGGNVSLVRPVAQLSVAAATGAGSAQLQSSQMKVSGLYTSLNIATNAVSNGAELTYAQAPLPEEDADPAYTPVVMNHIGFIPTVGAQLTIDFTFHAAGGMSKDLTVSNVPVKPNYKTNITLGADWDSDVNVDDSDAVAAIGTAKYKSLQAAFDVVETSQTVTLLKDITLQETAVLAEGETAVLDLNGFTLSIADVENKYALANLGTLTIMDSKGGGQVNAKGIYNSYNPQDASTPYTPAVLTIEGGIFNFMNNTFGSAVYNHGIVVLNGGTFNSLGGYTLSNQSGSKMTINGNVKVTNGIYNTGAILTINGGEFSATGSNKVLVAYNSTVTINGGTFTGEFQVSGGTLTDNRNKQ
jgi:hypothetical protein